MLSDTSQPLEDKTTPNITSLQDVDGNLKARTCYQIDDLKDGGKTGLFLFPSLCIDNSHHSKLPPGEITEEIQAQVWKLFPTYPENCSVEDLKVFISLKVSRKAKKFLASEKGLQLQDYEPATSLGICTGCRLSFFHVNQKSYPDFCFLKAKSPALESQVSFEPQM